MLRDNIPPQPPLADIFIFALEKVIISCLLTMNYHFHDHRYVDSIVAYYIGTNKQLNIFLNISNCVHLEIAS